MLSSATATHWKQEKEFLQLAFPEVVWQVFHGVAA
jgi:hypothetical protein